MGDDLHPSIIEFFERRMLEHSNVADFQRLEVDGEIVYSIKRRKFGDEIRVWLSDAYHFSEMDFYNKPKEIVEGDFILIARPEAGATRMFSSDIYSRISTGKIGDFMGALNIRNMWKYVPPDKSTSQRS